MHTFHVNNSRILTIKNLTFSVYHFYMNFNIWGDFGICISVPLSSKYRQKLLDHAKQSARDILETASKRAIKKHILETASKRAIKKTTEAATGDLNGSRTANKITKNSGQNNSNRRKIKDNKTTNYWRSKIIILIK